MKRVVILILTLTFLAVLYYALTTTSYAFSFVDVEKEGFTSAAPTRASDCNCLPGYIPSKDSGGKYGGNILKFKFNDGRELYYYNPSGSNALYFYDSYRNTCGLPTSGDFPMLVWSDVKNNLSSTPQSKYELRGMLRCDVVKKNTNTQETFFCQRLGDPSSRRECY
jgi:hypothetical protein